MCECGSSLCTCMPAEAPIPRLARWCPALVVSPCDSPPAPAVQVSESPAPAGRSAKPQTPVCRSVFEGSTRNTSSMAIKMLSRAAVKGGDGQCLRAQLPYIRSDLPILVVFRALGFVVRPWDCSPAITGAWSEHSTRWWTKGWLSIAGRAVSTDTRPPVRLLRAASSLPCAHQSSSLGPARSERLLTLSSTQRSAALFPLLCHSRLQSSTTRSQRREPPTCASCEGSPAAPDWSLAAACCQTLCPDLYRSQG